MSKKFDNLLTDELNSGFGFSRATVLAVIKGTPNNDNLVGTTGDDTMRGLGGDDVLEAGNGNDKLDGGNGNDALYGDAGDDILYGGAGNDLLSGGIGSDTFVYSTGHDLITDSGFEPGDKLVMQGINQSDVTAVFDMTTGHVRLNVAGTGGWVDLASTSGALTVQFADGTVDFNDLTITMNGTSGNDYFSGLNQPVIQNGFDGNDQLHGGNYNDILNGGNGDDVLDGGAGDDILDGGAGKDVYVYTGGNDTIVSGMTGLAANETIIMQGIQQGDVTVVYNLADTGLPYLHLNVASTGDSLAVTMSDNGPVLLQFTDGTLDLNTMTVTMEGTSGDDFFSPVGVQSMIENGYGGNDTMWGSISGDQINGGKGDDVLHGNLGSDILVGGKGNDTLYGDADLDFFYFVKGGGVDTVMDFSTADGDKIDISELLDVAVDPTDEAIADFVQFSYDSSTGATQMYVDADGTGSTSSAQLVAVFNNAEPTYNDLITSTPHVA